MSHNLQLKDVYFYYTRIQEPVDGYQTTDILQKKYTTEVLVSKEQFKDFTTKYPKKKRQPVEADEFEAKYKTPVPKEFEGQPLLYLIKLDVKAFKKDETPMPDSLRPAVYMRDEDGKLVNVTATTLVGNGSKGVINYIEFTNEMKDGTTVISPKLAAILVTDLVEYEKKSTTNTAHSF